MRSKQHFIEKLESLLDLDQNAKILDLGSGQSRSFIPLLEKFPDLHYVGIEPQKSEAEIAKSLLKNFKNATIYNQLAYEEIDIQNDFDLCISLSVLEHVKQLDKFLINSVKFVKKGGYIIHRYDLGHALYPGSLKEKVQIFLGNNFPKLLPETKFVKYLNEKEICEVLENNGAKVQEITYHQMPNHKTFLNLFNTDTAEKVDLAEEILEWEYKVSKFLPEIEQKQRELLFPTINIQAVKK